MPLSDADLAAIEARVQAATPGPWQWRGESKGKEVYLAAVGRSGGVNIVMDPCRAGFNGASVRFAVDGILRDPPLIRPESHNPWRITGVDHPDAEFIAASRTDLPRVVADLRELRATVLAHIRLRYSGDTTEQILWSLDDQAGLSPELAADFAAEARMIRLALGQEGE